MQYAQALSIANDLIERLSPACERLAIAGSVRRGKPEVHDLELVAIPRYVPEQTGLFTGVDFPDEPAPEVSALDAALKDISGRRIKNGPRYKQIALPEGTNLDLFITDWERWGWTFLLRTGPADFSHWLVKPKRYGGGLPSYLRADEGALWRDGEMLETPEEQDALDALGLSWIEPSERKPLNLQIARRAVA